MKEPRAGGGAAYPYEGGDGCVHNWTEVEVFEYGNAGLLFFLGAGDSGSGGSEAQKKKDLIKAALAEKNLSSCLHMFFGPGTILTNANLQSSGH